MTVCNTMFEKEDSKLVSYDSGTHTSTVDYILCRACYRSMIWDVKILPNEICVLKHKLLVMDMKVRDVKKVCRLFEPKLKIWRLQNKQIKDEFAVCGAPLSLDSRIPTRDPRTCRPWLSISPTWICTAAENKSQTVITLTHATKVTIKDQSKQYFDYFVCESKAHLACLITGPQ